MIVLVDYLKEKPFEQSVIWFNENFVYKSLLLSPKLDRTSLLVKVCLQLFVFNWPFSTTFSCRQKKCTFYFLPINRKKAGTVNTLLLVNAPERKGQNARSIEICTLGIWTMCRRIQWVVFRFRLWQRFFKLLEFEILLIIEQQLSQRNLDKEICLEMGNYFHFAPILIDNCLKRQLPKKTFATLKDFF